MLVLIFYYFSKKYNKSHVVTEISFFVSKSLFKIGGWYLLLTLWGWGWCHFGSDIWDLVWVELNHIVQIWDLTHDWFIYKSLFATNTTIIKLKSKVLIEIIQARCYSNFLFVVGKYLIVGYQHHCVGFFSHFELLDNL